MTDAVAAALAQMADTPNHWFAERIDDDTIVVSADWKDEPTLEHQFAQLVVSELKRVGVRDSAVTTEIDRAVDLNARDGLGYRGPVLTTVLVPANPRGIDASFGDRNLIDAELAAEVLGFANGEWFVHALNAIAVHAHLADVRRTIQDEGGLGTGIHWAWGADSGPVRFASVDGLRAFVGSTLEAGATTAVSLMQRWIDGHGEAFRTAVVAPFKDFLTSTSGYLSNDVSTHNLWKRTEPKIPSLGPFVLVPPELASDPRFLDAVDEVGEDVHLDDRHLRVGDPDDWMQPELPSSILQIAEALAEFILEPG